MLPRCPRCHSVLCARRSKTVCSTYNLPHAEPEAKGLERPIVDRMLRRAAVKK